MAMRPAKSNGGGMKISNPDPGYHDAILYGIVDIGTQRTMWNEKESFKRKMVFMWELPRSIFRHPESGLNLPHVVTAHLTNTSDPRGVVWKIINSWRGVDLEDSERNKFDYSVLLGKHCTLQIKHTPRNDGDGVWVNVVGAGPPNDACKSLALTNEIQKYWIPENGFNIPENIYSWLVDKIELSKEFKSHIANETGQQNHDPIRDVNHDNIEPPQEPEGGIDPEDMAKIEELKGEAQEIFADKKEDVPF
jgi:hypothetical protein